MRLRRFISPVVTLALLGAAGYAAYRTHDRWAPYVFPTQPAAKSGDGHADEKDDGHDAHAGHDHGPRDDRVKLTPQAQRNLRLDVDTLIPEEYWRTILIPGVVVDRPGESDRRVSTCAAGIVSQIMARPGDTVRVGDPLFTIQLVSELVQSTQTDLAKAAKELEFARVKVEQTRNLVAKGTKSGIILLEEENALKRQITQVQGYRRQLVLFGLTTDQVDRAEKGDVITEITVTAQPQDPVPATTASAAASSGQKSDFLYEVQELRVQLNEQVQAGQALCTLANHQQLFVEGLAFKSEAKALAVAAQKAVKIEATFYDETAGDWPEQGPLVIHHLSNQVDPATRTFAFYMALDNQAETFTRNGKGYYVWRYRPGQRVRLRVPVEKLATYSADGKQEKLPFVLPAGAVVREGPEAFVFVQSGDMFIRKPVQVLYEDRNEVVIANDGSVTEADFVVRNQAAAINRALKAANAGGGADPHAGHDHG